MASRLVLIITAIVFLLLAEAPPTTAEECNDKWESCRNKAESLKLKVIAIFSILVTSMIGVSIPLFSRSVPALQPDRDLFVLVKAFASGVILATGYMHVLPDSFEDLTSVCLPERPWRKFPFTTFIAMLSAVLTLVVDSYCISFFKKKLAATAANANGSASLEAGERKEVEVCGHGHGNDVTAHADRDANIVDAGQLLRYRVVAQVLELGIVVHSVVIGLSMGASMNPCTIRPLIAAICFHQMFEGMGLGGCILQAEYGMKVKAIMVFFFSITTPLGIVLGIALSNVYSDTNSKSLIVEGVLNAISAGLLNYMALVELLASDFMGSKIQGSAKIMALAFVAVLLGAGGMSVMAIWA
ncbi:fe(2+) transport protein 1-like [Vigna radiata var. radiata]|uniref:Fe(2+) transport protein 1-like n=1 Tax=Vigna radiata var. radiata TaxID=3916 RepID=A0A1S3UJR0_VIGRR|nr:fe(2+) transport protein 1-like [Vigna radiata var. radiata]